MNNNPAFPHIEPKDPNKRTSDPVYHPGLSLRDYFAAQALVGITSLSNDPRCPTIQGQASLCYELADAMLKERNRNE